MPKCAECGEGFFGSRAEHNKTHAAPEVEEAVEEVAPVEAEPAAPPVKLVPYFINGYELAAPEGATLLYSESDPVNGVTKAVFQTAMAAGDGRPSDPAGQYVWRKA